MGSYFYKIVNQGVLLHSVSHNKPHPEVDSDRKLPLFVNNIMVPVFQC